MEATTGSIKELKCFFLKLASKVRTLHSSIMASSEVRFPPSASCFLPLHTHCHYLEATEKVQLLITSCCHAPKGSRTWGPCQIKRDNRDSNQRIRCNKTASILCNVVMALGSQDHRKTEVERTQEVSRQGQPEVCSVMDHTGR